MTLVLTNMQYHIQWDLGREYEADRAGCWDNLTTSDIVYFPGTKIIGTSPDGDGGILILDDPSDGHGTAVTGSVIDANPDAVIFFVEGFSDTAVLAAANQPLVDVISTSFGAIDRFRFRVLKTLPRLP